MMTRVELPPIHPLSYRGQDLESMMVEYWAENPNPVDLLETFEPEITEHSIFMAGHGVSHRQNFPIQVGATVVGLSEAGVFLTEGSNCSPYRGAPKDCAEVRAYRMGDMRMEAFRDEFGLAWKALKTNVATRVASDNIHELTLNQEINGLDAPTLHPCSKPCRALVSDHHAVTPDMPIETISVAPNGTVVARQSFQWGEMIDMYRNVQPPLTSRELQLRR